MVRTSKFLGILSSLVIATLASSVAFGDGMAFNFRPGGGGAGGGGGRGGAGGGGGRGGPSAQPASNQQQFFSQSNNHQQAFFAQPVFPNSGFTQTQSLQRGTLPAFSSTPVFPGQTWISPPVNYYLPPNFYSGFQPGFYVAPTVYGVGGTTVVQSTTVYTTPQPVNSYSTASSQPRLTFGMIGRW